MSIKSEKAALTREMNDLRSHIEDLMRMQREQNKGKQQGFFYMHGLIRSSYDIRSCQTELTGLQAQRNALDTLTKKKCIKIPK